MGEGPTAALLQQIFEVDPLACPTCHGPMRVVAFITKASVIDRHLAHLRTRAEARHHAPHARPPTPRLPPEDAPPDAPRPRGADRCTRLSARRGALARSVIARYAQRIVDPPRLKLLSRGVPGRRAGLPPARPETCPGRTGTL